MFGKTYLTLLQSLLEFDFNILCPWKDDSDNSKLSKMFRASLAGPLTMALMTTTFVYYEWNNLPLAIISENMAIAIAFCRSIGYSVLVRKFFIEYKKQVDKLIDDRKSLPLDPKEKALTDSYCKTEFTLNVIFHLNCYCIVFLLLHVFVYFAPNAYQLLFNCYAVFLPPDGFMFAYELNYLIMSLAAIFTAVSIASYVSIPFLLMNHSCWYLDMVLITAQNINEDVQPDEDVSNKERIEKTKQNLKKLVERCEKFVEWQREVQNLLFWYFNLEFQVQALILCLSIYTLSSTFSGAILLLFFFCGTQIFVLCWMGTRVTSRIDQLSFEVTQNWYLMPPVQRKTLQMILHWTQNMKAFSGLFKDVNLETCKTIFEASYSFYAFLRSTSDNAA